MGLLTRDAILSATDLPREQITVPEWGGDVLVQGLDGAGRDFWELTWYRAGQNGQTAPANFRALLVALTLVSDQGVPLFSTDDVVALGKKSPTALDRVYEVALRLSGLAKEAVEDAETNLGLGQNSNSGSS